MVVRLSCAPQRDGKWMRLRAFLLGAALLALFGVVLLRAAKVQLLDRSRLARLQRDQTRRELEWAPRRGMIVDRRGEPLAVTQDVDSVFADPSAFETPRVREAAAAQLAGALRLDRRKIAEKLAQPDRRFVWIKRRIDEASARRVRGLAIDGIELVKEPKRFYPQRELAGHVLGFVGDESGQEGLERELEQHLRGRSAQVQATRDARGTMVLEHGAPDPADLTGATVTLTLDSAIELAAERELARAVKASGAIGGWAVVLDVNTGAVLALAGNPAFDANKPGRDPMVWRDRAVQDQLEPGSTIKSFVVARALADPRRMPQIALSTTAFGQGMSATAMQTVAAMAAIANGGVLLRPFLVQKVVAADGTTLLSRGREEVRRVLKEDTARELTAMLEEVVEKGTGTRAALLGHRVADDAAREATAELPIRPGQARVPDVSGLGARSAMRRLAQSSLEPELRGSGRAVAQSPRAGAIVKRGARVKVTLAPPG